MSEKKYKENKSIIPLVSTIVIAVIAIVLAIVAIMTLKKDKPGENSSSTAVDNFVPTDALIEECTYAAHDLVRDNFSVIRLYITEGLAHFDEPYGNLPEDGIYTVNSTEYSSPMLTTRTTSPYFSLNSAIAPVFLASSMGISFAATG